MTSRAGGPRRSYHAPARTVVALAADPASAGAARTVLRQVLRGTDAERWLEPAELACTELVSNAVLHAHTEVTLEVELSPGELRVQVSDRSPVLPLQRSYDTQATTGRGMTLVAAVTSEHGVSDAGPSGKTVWFVLRGDPAEQSEQDLLDAWDDAAWDDLDTDTPPAGAASPFADDRPGRTVDLLALPPTLWLAAREHHDALLRELALYVTEHAVPSVDLAGTDRARGTLSGAVWAAVEQAQRDGTARPALPVGHPSPLPWVPAHLDLQLFVPAGSASAYSAMQDTLDAAERLAVAGLLLARPGLPEIIAVRDWACEQVVAQHAGVPAAPWRGTAQERFTTAVHARADLAGEWDDAPVREADRGVVAADDANRIIAVSRSLAELVGWDPGELVGRRVVTLIPPHLREGHVAGFSRSLTSGEAHLLGVPLVLPVLHADGAELACRFLIEQVPGGHGRVVYLAWVDALPTA